MLPFTPFLGPALPLPCAFTTIPSPTPAGIFISTTSSPLITPVPPQDLHLFFIICPSPPQFGHSDVVCIMPNIDCWERYITPLPWHCVQVWLPEPSALPV